MAIRFFLDFDGTITTNDVVDKMLERYANPLWRQIEQEWVEGRIGSRECLSRQIALVRADESEMESLVREVKIDPGFVPFIKKAKSLTIPVAIVSDGFDFIIRRALERAAGTDKALFNDIPVYSNDLSFQNKQVTARFPEGEPCGHGCANCKVRVIESLKKSHERAVFVGDGLSDRFAAGISDLTFAKSKLLTFCRESKLRHLPYESFSEIEAWLAGDYREFLSEKISVSSK